MSKALTDLPVLLPFRAPTPVSPSGLASPVLLGGATLAAFAILFGASLALAQVTARPAGESARPCCCAGRR
jgi:polar amino acid transport system permease protein